MILTSEYVLEGACLALEHASVLLNDAVILYEHGSFSSSLALAAHASEELGKSRIYRDLEREIASGKMITLKDLKDCSEGHVAKHKAAITGIAYGGDVSTGLGAAILGMTQCDPNSETFKQAKAIADTAGKAIFKRFPDERHRQRNQALYVDPVDVTKWQSPRNITKEDARMYITHIRNDYANVQGNLEFREEDANVFAFLQTNANRFQLLYPKWPS
jgi:AbiV family abortive infection protein